MSGSNAFWDREHLMAVAAAMDLAAPACTSCGLSDHLGRFSELCAYCSELHMRRARARAVRHRVVLYYALACAVWLMVVANIAIGTLILAGVIR